MKRKIAIFDIDGTIFRSSLLVELTEALLQAGIFPSSVRKIYTRSYKEWIERQGSYEQYISDVVLAFTKHMKGIRNDDFDSVASHVAHFHRKRVYRYSRDLLNKLRKEKYYLLAISNSPKVVLDYFGKELGFDKIYGRIFETDSRGKLTGQILYTDFISDKAKVLSRVLLTEHLTLQGSIGVGDTESDIPFLKMVSKPICFNPNKKLFDYAKKQKWNVVVERKDVIYKF